MTSAPALASASHEQIAVNHGLTVVGRRKRPARYKETTEYLAMVRRMVRGAGRRVGDGDPDELRVLAGIQADLDLAKLEAVRGLRAAGHTWSEIGGILGVSKQAVCKLYGPRLAAVPEMDTE